MQGIPDLAESGTVKIIRVLATGELISSREEYERVADRFDWEDRKQILTRLLELKERTDHDKKSVIVIYENGRHMKEYVNVDLFFRLSSIGGH